MATVTERAENVYSTCKPTESIEAASAFLMANFVGWVVSLEDTTGLPDKEIFNVEALLAILTHKHRSFTVWAAEPVAGVIPFEATIEAY